MDDMMMDPGLFGPADPGAGDAAAEAKPKEDFTVRKKAELITEVKELKLRFYTLALKEDAELIEDGFRQKVLKSKFFSNEKDGYEILENETAEAKDGLTSYTVLVKLKEPIRK